MINLGTVKPGTTLDIPFHTFDSNDPSASVTITGLATTDIEIYKNGSATTRASDSGYALLDTDGIDFDSKTGIHGFSVDLADNSVAGFYSAGARYWVIIASVTVDGATVNFVAATFTIGYDDAIINTTIASVTDQTQFILTAGPAEADVLIGCSVLFHDVASAVQLSVGYITDYIVTTKEVFLAAGPGGFTFVATDNVSIFMPANVRAVAGSVTAGDNLKLQYDGTGLTGDTFPSPQSQVGSIAVGAGGISQIAESATITTGTETLTFASTEELDGTTHDVAAVGGATEFYYQFDVGVDGVATEFVWFGYAQSNNDSYAVFAFDWVSTTFKQIGTIAGGNGTSISEQAFIPVVNMTGTGANAGKVRLQFTSADGTEIFTDRVLCEFTQAVTGIANGTTITLGADTISTNLVGKDWILALGGQNITNSFISGATVTGTGTATAKYEFEECDLGAVTLDDAGHFERCGLENTFTVGQAGTFTFHQCFTQAGSSITIDFGALGATTVHLFDFHGEVNFKNMAAGDTVHITGAGTITTETCTAGTIDHDGFFEYTDAGTNVTEVQSDIKVAVDATLVDTQDIQTRLPAALVNSRMDSTVDAAGFEQGAIDNVWDEVLTGASHNNATSAGRRLRLTSEIVQVESAVDDPGAAATTTVFNTDLTEVDDFWNDALLIFTSGALAGQSRTIKDFANTNGQVTFDEALTSAPVNNVTFSIRSDHIHPISMISDSILRTQMVESYAANGVAPTQAQALFAIHQMLMQFGIAGTSITVRKLDDSTTAFVVTLDSATEPTDAKRV